MGRVFVLISGKMQDLGFHESLRRCASDLGLRGGVRYFGLGQVEALFAGECEAAHQVVLFLREGPSGARLSELRVRVELARGSGELGAQWSAFRRNFPDQRERPTSRRSTSAGATPI
jgi:acylphosphatase